MVVVLKVSEVADDLSCVDACTIDQVHFIAAAIVNIKLACLLAVTMLLQSKPSTK